MGIKGFNYYQFSPFGNIHFGLFVVHSLSTKPSSAMIKAAIIDMVKKSDTLSVLVSTQLCEPHLMGFRQIRVSTNVLRLEKDECYRSNEKYRLTSALPSLSMKKTSEPLLREWGKEPKDVIYNRARLLYVLYGLPKTVQLISGD